MKLVRFLLLTAVFVIPAKSTPDLLSATIIFNISDSNLIKIVFAISIKKAKTWELFLIKALHIKIQIFLWRNHIIRYILNLILQSYITTKLDKRINNRLENNKNVSACNAKLF